MNIMMLLEMASSGFGDRVALGDRTAGLTYTQLFDRVGRAATAIAASDAHNVVLAGESSPALPISLFASSWVGRPFVPLNYRLDATALTGLAERCAPSYAVCDLAQEALLAPVDGVQVIGRQAFLDELDRHEPATPEWGFDGEDTAILLFTSGTTGEPKAAVLRQKHLVSYILTSVEFMGAGEDEATLVSVPPYHIAGIAAMLSSIYVGRRIVQLPHFEADAWIDLANAQGITHAMVVPTMLARIAERLDARGESIPTLRALSYGGGKMPLPIIERALELLPSTAFVNAYGLTETSSTIALLGPDDHRAAMASDDPIVRRRLTSAGKPLPSIELSIRDAAGSEVGPDTPGEIWVRGEQVSGEYQGMGSRLNDEGWFPTHDGGWLDAEGYLFVTGRIDDVIIRGGENISPGEIEAALLRHPSVSEAACIGVPDAQWGEVVCAAVVCDDTVEPGELQDYVRENLRSSKVPEHVAFVEQLPYNDTGKLLRRKLRDELAHLGDDSS